MRNMVGELKCCCGKPECHLSIKVDEYGIWIDGLEKEATSFAIKYDANFLVALIHDLQYQLRNMVRGEGY